MKITSIQSLDSKDHCLKIQLDGLKKKDGLVTLTEESVVSYCREEGADGLCTGRFKADLVVDQLDELSFNQVLRCGTLRFQVTSRQKRCHPGCALDPTACQLIGRIFFLKVLEEGTVCVGDSLE